MNRSKLVIGFILVISSFQAFGTELYVNFNDDPVAAYTSEMLKSDWGSEVWPSLNGRESIVTDASDPQSKALRVTYPKGAVGPTQGGFQLLKTLDARDEYYLSYRIKFEQGFDFQLGGKLPGLTSGGVKYTGGNIPTNGEGWSARFMWRENGRAVVYLYYVDMPGQWGEDIDLGNFYFQPGIWYQLTQHIVVNSGDQKNGILEVWIDKNKVLSRNNIRFRLGNQGLIDSFYLSTFHGGEGSQWAPDNDSYTQFDDFRISEKDLLNVPAGNTNPPSPPQNLRVQ